MHPWLGHGQVEEAREKHPGLLDLGKTKIPETTGSLVMTGGSVWRNDLLACRSGLSGASTEDEGGTYIEAQWHDKTPPHPSLLLTPETAKEAPRPSELGSSTCPVRGILCP